MSMEGDEDLQRMSEMSASSMRYLRRIKVAMLALKWFQISISKYTTQRVTYKTPSDKMKATVAFVCVLILTDQIMGIGRMAYIQSVTIVRTEIE